MSPTDLLKTMRDRPFISFRLFLSDGTSHDVRHPEMLLVGIRTSHLSIPDREKPEFVDWVVRIDNLHITKIVPLAQIEQAA